MGRVRAVRAAIGACLCAAMVVGGPGVASAAVTPDGTDVDFILEQIKKAEADAAGGELLGSGPNQVASPLLPFGLRTVDGRFNNIVPGQESFGAADRLFPRLLDPFFRPAEFFDPDGPGPDPGSVTNYEQTTGMVVDSRPRTISNLIVDLSTDNPAAVAAAAQTPGSETVDHDGDPATPQQHFIPNRAPDTGLSAPFNAWFIFFGQFFDHGLDLTNKGGSGTVLVPLKPDDPLYVPGSSTNFMVLTRATNQKGPDGMLGTSDDVREHVNQTTPFVDQNQTYTSHPSHQVFLREYELDGNGKPVATGRLLDRPGVGGLATWADVKAQARDLLGIALDDQDVLNLPLVKTDDYGRFIPDANGFPQIVTDAGDPPAFNSGTPASPVDASTAVRTKHAFLDDLAHHAAPFGDHDNDPSTPRQALDPDADATTGDDNDAATYDNELLDAHFITGDGRGNENIGLTAVHHVFHAEHNLRVGEIRDLIEQPGGPNPADWQLSPGVWNGERLFQAARFVTEMEYQHLVFEEFARKVQPQVNVFAGYDETIDPAIVAEFAHTVYRFGHSMLIERVGRTNADGSDNSLGLIQAFLNPLAFNDGGSAGTLSPQAAAGSIARGTTRDAGNEIDEFVTGAVRTNLVGLPLDLATINITRGRDTGVPPLNEARRRFRAATGSSALAPYESWNDFKLGIKHPESLVNFIAAYGKHDSITGASTVADKRAAADLIVNGGTGEPPDRLAFLDGPAADTGVDDIDFWVGGLAEKQLPFGGLLGSTFNFVFETQMEKLQDGDRLYYLARTAGLNFLTQLEQNSFAELVMRTTDTTHLPIDIFSRPDFVFELANIGASGPPQDDPATPDWNEAELLTRSTNGTVRFGGAEHVVFGGTDGADKIASSEGDDTLWGDGGNDRLEGGAGNDGFKGGTGNDTLLDLFGDDTIDGGPGDDVINAGGGFDLILGDSGRDFIVGGEDPKETFAGGGDDFVIGGDSSDLVFGDRGDDWIEGGAQGDEVEGDHGAPIQDDRTPSNDVLIGDGGNDDLHGEGGQDVLVTGPGIEDMEGLLGFDWVTHRGDPEPGNADLNRLVGLPPDLNAIRDRFRFTEAVSGWDKHDVLRGDDANAATMSGHELTDVGLVDGLDGLLGGASSFTGGNIILGGDGSDLLEGRGGNDVIDGDRWLNVRISVRDPGDPGVELRSVNSMRSIQADVFAGDIKPSQLRVMREIKTATPGPEDVDTAVFSEPRANYDLGALSTTLMTVRHIGGTQIDGTDTLRNIERLTFADQTIEIDPLATNTPPDPTSTVNISDTTPSEDQELTASPSITDADGVNGQTLVFSWQTETDVGSWTTIGTGVAFTPDDEAVGARLRVVATYQDGDGISESVTSAPTDPVTNVNDPPSGRPLLGDTTPVEGQPVTAHTGTISDADGLVGVNFAFQWQEDPGSGFVDIGGATRRTFTPTQAQVGRPLRVVVSFTDNHGTGEQVTSLASSPVTAAAAPAAPGPIPPAQQPSQAPPASSPDPPASTPDPPASPSDPAPLRAAGLRVSVRSGLLVVSARIPQGARVVRIRVFRLAQASATRGSLVATVFKRTSAAKRYVFRLNSGKLRRLAVGRYRVEVSVGRSRSDLGPATSRTVRIRPRR